MLSRLAARTIAPRALSVRAFTRSSILRDSKPTTPTPTATPTPAPAVEAVGPAAALAKYGTLGFWGGLAAILVTKEVFILNAEFLLSLEIAAFAGTAYVLTGDTIDKMSREMDQKKTEQFEGANEFLLEMINQYKTVQLAAQNKPEVVEQYLTEYKRSIEAHAAYQTVLPQHAARASVITTLESMKTREEHAAAMLWDETVVDMVESVENSFRAKADLRNSALEEAINNIGTSPDPEAVGPVKEAFMSEFNAYETVGEK